MKETKTPPDYLRWNTPLECDQGKITRKWFGDELQPQSLMTVRGIGIYEPMINANVDRPYGTGDWLIMLFHHPARLEQKQNAASVPANTLMIWPTGAKQFFSWATEAGVELHSWMHVEGTWVSLQIDNNLLPLNTPITLSDSSVMTDHLQSLMDEMLHPAQHDPIIIQNLFQNWARSIARQLDTKNPTMKIPAVLLTIKHHLDEHYNQGIVLDELADMAGVSRSYLCHQFRSFFNTSISQYVIRKRMSIAQRLLFNAQLRLGNIASEVGYTDIYQFSKQFKKTFGVSPSKYRAQQQNKTLS
ncbi:AraC family transcriptional regulator [uncultured Paraglaciecola sp.]|uniref:helix-turn-helix domain-containing protein n=1 Tax=uncultured Paraglaciecola sp. TaxID=1765024 RepID=UPI0030DC3161|tara:strand:+ start:237299 stop:238201 length:903 start_codon:yes stop_codon:yes gene_type:complete